VFQSQTDTEVIAHLVDSLYDGDIFEAVKAAIAQLHGAYAIAVFCKDEPQRADRRAGRIAADPGRRQDGHGENFLASDAMALAGVTDQIVYLDEGDVVDLQLGKYWLVDKAHKAVPVALRPVKTVQAHSGAAELGPYRHYMQKEIFEQPRAIGDTLEGVYRASWPTCSMAAPTARTGCSRTSIQGADPGLRHQLLQRLHGQVLAGGDRRSIPTQVEVASEYRYRDSVPEPEDAGGHHHPERRDGRHAGGPAPCAVAGHDPDADDLQRGHQRHGA
jgi:glucosamine--fructose-6-phosphate aminotransferase (isomerizing)